MDSPEPGGVKSGSLRRHGRQVSRSAATLTRTLTGGPLQDGGGAGEKDPLSLHASSPARGGQGSGSGSSAAAAAVRSRSPTPKPRARAQVAASSPAPEGRKQQQQQQQQQAPEKDFSFLLRTEMYHPVNTIDTPPPFRSRLSQIEKSTASSSSSSASAASTQSPTHFLSSGHFRNAAAAAVTRLTSSQSPPLQSEEIFQLLYIRLACLVLLGAKSMASSEAGSMGDLQGETYRKLVVPIAPKGLDSMFDAPPKTRSQDGSGNVELDMGENVEGEYESVLPWELLLLATELQHQPPSAGTVSALFDLGRYARGRYVSLLSEDEGVGRDSGSWEGDGRGKNERKEEMLKWKARLRDLGIRVANALVEMGDWEGARRHLEGLRTGLGRGLDDREEDEMLRGRIAMVCVRVGDLGGAREVLGIEGEGRRREGGGDGKKVRDGEDGSLDGDEDDVEQNPSPYAEALLPLLYLAEGSYDKAHEQLQTGLLPSDLRRANQAVTWLYEGRLAESRNELEALVDEGVKGRDTGGPARAVLFNLATVVELATDRARQLKLQLAEKVAGAEGGSRGGWERGVGDFKL